MRSAWHDRWVDFAIKCDRWLPILCAVTAPWAWSDGCAAAEPDFGWGKERVEAISSTRGRICLNGLWRFAPGDAEGAAPKVDEGWGAIRVPGFWGTSHGAPGIESRGSGEHWRDSGPSAASRSCWYERKITVPKGWGGRAIILECTRLEGAAQFWVDGEDAGRIEWPGGEADITPMAKAGSEHTLRVKIERPSGGAYAGIGGDVFLFSRPKGRHIAGVVTSSSTSSSEVSLRILIRGSGKAGDVSIAAAFSGEGASKRFTGSTNMSPDGNAALQFAWRWTDAPLWKVRAPKLLSLKVEVDGPDFRDEWSGPFGFREFTWDGRWLRLNGAKERLVAAPSPGGGTLEAMAAELRRLAGAGFNAVVCDGRAWEPGRGAPDAAWLCEAASREGLLVIAPVAGLTTALDGWSRDRGDIFWNDNVAREVGRLGAWPSVVAWSTDDGGLHFSGGAHPARFGVRSWPSSESWRDRARVAGFALEAMRRADPWRPVMVSGGGPLGEIDAPRAMAGWAPTQEVEDWPSKWAEAGEMPFIAIDCWPASGVGIFARGREWLGPLVAEHAAAELGPAAYAQEDSVLRRLIGDDPNNWRPEVVGAGPMVQELGERFLGRVARAWRAWGVAALPLAPTPGVRTLHLPTEGGPVQAQPGTRGWVETAERAGVWPWPMEATFAGPTVAWIAGPPESFTSKDHHYIGGSRVEKSLALVNDGNAETSYAMSWRAEIAGQEVGFGDYKGHLAARQMRSLPVEFTCPVVNLKADGKISFEGDMGGRPMQGQFAVRVYPAMRGPEPGHVVHVFDPSGETSRVLRSIGFKVQTWDGKREAGRVLVIGRGALSAGPSVPGSFEQFATDGGRVLICPQDRDWIMMDTAFRANPRAERACWEVQTQRSHPLIRGLDAVDLSDWSGGHGARPGASAPDPGSALRIGALFPPPWGDRGVVSAAAPEKPHHGGWRPIIECGFDLSYAPLMELAHGRGVILWCSMEVDSRAENDPVARELLMRMLAYLGDFRPAPERGPTYYTGGETWRARLDAMGVDFQPVQAMPKVPGLLVVAPDSPIVDRLIEEHLDRGGSALFLPRESDRLPLGFTAKPGSNYGRPQSLPAWPECQGISFSDVRTRSDIKAPLVVGGPGEVGADGMLARLQKGAGVAVYVQVGPDQIAAAMSSALSLSECRNLGMLSRLMANMGATFETDRRAFTPGVDPFLPIAVDGEWRIRVEPGQPRDTADGSLGESAGWPQPGLDVRDWKTVSLPGSWKDADRALAFLEGAVWLRRDAVLPKAWADRPLMLRLGHWHGDLIAYFNGRRLGRGAISGGRGLVVSVPQGLAVEGENTIAIRVWGGGVSAGSFSRDREVLRLEVAGRRLDRGYYQTGKDGEPLTSDRLLWLPDMDSNHD